MRRSMTAAVLVMACAAGASAVGRPDPADAAPSTAAMTPDSACPNGGVAWEDEGDTYSFTQASGSNSRVSGDPGVTLSISTSTAFTETGSIGTATGITTSDVITTVKTDVNVTISKGYTKTSSNSGSWTVPASYTNGGALAIGTRKHRGSVQKWQVNAFCAPSKIMSSVSYNAPETGWYFKRFRL